MELTEPIEIINQRLIDYFGIDTISSLPIYRIVWSEDQFEKQLTKFTKDGLELLYPEVREMPKYRQWIQAKYILERLSLVPEINQDQLGAKISYEPLYVFEDKSGNALPPKWEVTQFAIDCVNAAMGKGTLHKYIDPENTQEAHMQAKMERVEKIEEEMFGNETDVTDALRYKSGIIVPSNYEQVIKKSN